MFCQNCKNELSSNSKFCTNCGASANLIDKNSTDIRDDEIQNVINNFRLQDEKNSHNSKSKFPWLVFLIIAFIVFMLFLIFSDEDDELIDDNGPSSSPSIVNSIDEEDLIKSSIVSIYCEDDSDDENAYSGTGAMISNDGFILTNSHLIPQDDEVLLTPSYGCIVTIPNPTTGKPKERYLAKPIVYHGLSDDYDLAFLSIYESVIGDSDKVSGGSAGFHSLEDICMNDAPKLGEIIRIYGYPMTTLNENLTVTEGVISNFDDSGLIFTSAKIDYGNSGGVAIDSNNCVIGVPSAIIIPEGATQNLGIIIPIKLVEQFIDEVIDMNEED